MKAFRRLLFLGMAPAAPIAVCSLAMAAARDGDWEPLSALAGDGRELAFETWDDAIAAFDFFARRAPAELCSALAQTRLAAKQPVSLRERGWWPPGAGEPGSADPKGLTMTCRLALLCRGAGWATRPESENPAALNQACARLGDPMSWEACAFSAILSAEAMAREPDQPGRLAFCAFPDNFPAALGARKTGEAVRGELFDARAALELCVASELGLAGVAGAALARADRGAVLGALKVAAATHRPRLPDPFASAFARQADQAWVGAFRQVQTQNERAACLAELFPSRFVASWPSISDSEAMVREIWRFAEQAWGLAGVARAWPAGVDAREFTPIVLAQRESDELDQMLVAHGPGVSQVSPNASAAQGMPSPHPGKTAASRGRRL
jgi:hypothetical protein